MKIALLVAIGGAAGALSRLGLASLVDKHTMGTKFPVGIVTVNLLGCLLIGWLYGLAEHRNWVSDPVTRWLLVVGFLGSFTTFSTFGNNTFDLLRSGHLAIAISQVIISVFGGLAAVWAGWAIAR